MPEMSISFWHRCLRAIVVPMPKTSMYEDCPTLRLVCKVRRARKRSDIQPVAQPEFATSTSDDLLRRRPLLADALHEGTPCWVCSELLASGHITRPQVRSVGLRAWPPVSPMLAAFWWALLRGSPSYVGVRALHPRNRAGSGGTRSSSVPESPQLP